MCRRPLLPLLALAVLMVNLPSSHALSCYQCSDAPGADIPKCSELDTGDDRFKTQCPVESIHTCSTVTRSDGEVIRGCYGEDKTPGCSDLKLGTITATECFCTSDYCNSAGLATPTMLMILPAAVIAALYTA